MLRYDLRAQRAPLDPTREAVSRVVLQMLYTIRSERLLMEQLDYNFLFRWFVGLSMDDPVWDVTVFTKNRERLLEGDVEERFFTAMVAQARDKGLLSEEHFTVDGTLIEAWAGQKSFQRKDNPDRHTPSDDPGNPASTSTARSAPTHPPIDHRSRGRLARRGGQGGQALLYRPRADGEPQRTGGQRLRDPGDRPRGTGGGNKAGEAIPGGIASRWARTRATTARNSWGLRDHQSPRTSPQIHYRH